MVGIAYLDFSKAFDLVCHEVLLEKSVALGFDSCLRSWVRGFLQCRYMSVSVAGKLSQEVEVSSGSTGFSTGTPAISDLSISLLQM